MAVRFFGIAMVFCSEWDFSVWVVKFLSCCLTGSVWFRFPVSCFGCCCSQYSIPHCRVCSKCFSDNYKQLKSNLYESIWPSEKSKLELFRFQVMFQIGHLHLGFIQCVIFQDLKNTLIFYMISKKLGSLFGIQIGIPFGFHVTLRELKVSFWEYLRSWYKFPISADSILGINHIDSKPTDFQIQNYRYQNRFEPIT